MNTKENKQSSEEISRKDAIKKMGKYAVLTAVGTFILLSPQKAQATSAPPPPGW
ncbi:MAG: hypothetical protein ACJAQX_002349 [Polaribacter sp.]|jgi:hypothetical protein|uniref:hypothetical protein n=1 Tax=Polaribacter sp. TaxID=1920175 RepID=UPI003AC1A43B